MPLICAFHANVDRSEAITIRQRYTTQETSTTLSAHELHLDITLIFLRFNKPFTYLTIYMLFSLCQLGWKGM